MKSFSYLLVALYAVFVALVAAKPVTLPKACPPVKIEAEGLRAFPPDLLMWKVTASGMRQTYGTTFVGDGRFWIDSLK
jgi:hypothetical protein